MANVRPARPSPTAEECPGPGPWLHSEGEHSAAEGLDRESGQGGFLSNSGGKSTSVFYSSKKYQYCNVDTLLGYGHSKMVAS